MEARLIDEVLAVDLRGGVLQLTAFGVVEAVAKDHTVDVIVKNGLNVAAHVVAVCLARLRADVKRCDTLVAMWRERGLDALGMIFGLMERSAADWY